MTTPPIVGPRVVLRDIRLDDLDAYAHWMHPDHLWQSFDGPYYGKTDPADIPAQIEKLRETIESGAFQTPRTRLAIADRATDALIGSVSWYWHEKATRWPAAGIVVYDPANWSRGLGYEALGLWVDYWFAALPDAHRLTLATWSGNAGMMRLAEKLGFREEARYREQRVVDGAYYDSMGYGVLRREWAARYPDGFAAHLAAGGAIAPKMGSVG